MEGNRALLAFLLIGIAGSALILMNTPWGVAVGYDSVFYISSARNLLEGLGLSWSTVVGEAKPLIHYPPLFPAALAGMGGLGFDFVAAAKWIAALSFGGSLTLIGWLTFRSTHSVIPALASAGIALVSPILIDVHLAAMSEPVFLLLLLAALGALAKSLDRSSAGWLVAAALLAGLAGLARYVGPAIVGAGALVLLLADGSWRRKLGSVALYGGLSLLMLSGWSLRNYLLSGTISNRVLRYHPITYENRELAKESITSWFISPPFDAETARTVALGSIVLVGVFLLIFGARFLLKSRPGAYRFGFYLTLSLLSFSFTYGLLLYVSLTYLDASTRLNNRILSPLYLSGILLAFVAFPSIWRLAKRSRVLLLLFAALWLTAATAYALRSWETLSEMRSSGQGFTSRAWQASETVRLVQSMDSDVLLYSNEAFPLHFLTGKSAYGVPEEVDPVRSEARSDFESQMERMRERLRTPKSALVLFTNTPVRRSQPSTRELTEGLALLRATGDGMIYVYPENLDSGLLP